MYIVTHLAHVDKFFRFLKFLNLYLDNCAMQIDSTPDKKIAYKNPKTVSWDVHSRLNSNWIAAKHLTTFRSRSSKFELINTSFHIWPHSKYIECQFPVKICKLESVQDLKFRLAIFLYQNFNFIFTSKIMKGTDKYWAWFLITVNFECST